MNRYAKYCASSESAADNLFMKGNYAAALHLYVNLINNIKHQRSFDKYHNCIKFKELMCALLLMSNSFTNEKLVSLLRSSSIYNMYQYIYIIYSFQSVCNALTCLFSYNHELLFEPRCLFLKGAILMNEEKYVEAISAYEASKIDGLLLKECNKKIATCHSGLMQYEDGLRLYNNSSNEELSMNELLLCIAMYYSCELFDRAIDKWKFVYTTMKNRFCAFDDFFDYYTCAFCAYYYEDYRMAKKYMENYLKFEHNDTKAKTLYASILIKLNFSKKAIAILKTLHSLNCADGNINYDIALCYYEIEHWDLAAFYFNKAIDLGYNTKNVWYILGNTYAHCENDEKAFIAFSNAMKKENAPKDTILQMAISLLNMQKYTQAKLILRDYLTENFGDSYAKYCYALCLFSEGKREIAYDIINEIINNNNVSEEIKNESLKMLDYFDNSG